MPPVHNDPPDHPEPLIDARLRPLPLSPPTSSKLRVVERSRDGECLISDFMLKDASRPAGMKIGGHNQDSAALLLIETLFCVVGFSLGRQTLYGTNSYAPPVKFLDVLLRQFDFGQTINSGSYRDIDQQGTAISLIHQLQPTLQATIGLPGKNQDYV